MTDDLKFNPIVTGYKNGTLLSDKHLKKKRKEE